MGVSALHNGGFPAVNNGVELVVELYALPVPTESPTSSPTESPTPVPSESPTPVPTESPTAPLNWVLVFRQTAPTLMTQAEAKRINPDDSDNDNYSILDTLEGDFRETDEGKGFSEYNKFTLKLVWPGLAGANSQSWRQESNPVTATSRGVVGYEVRCRVLFKTKAP